MEYGFRIKCDKGNAAAVSKTVAALLIFQDAFYGDF